MRCLIILVLLMVAANSLSAGEIDDGSIAETRLVLTDMGDRFHNVREITEGDRNVVLIFWQTWCVPCLREAPILVEVSKAHEKQLAFFGIISGSDDDVDEAKVRKIVEKFKLPYPQIRDRDLSITTRFEVNAIPMMVIIGDQGAILYKGNRLPRNWDEYLPVTAEVPD